MTKQLPSFIDFKGFCNPKRKVNQIQSQNHKEGQYEFSTDPLIKNILLSNNEDAKKAYFWCKDPKRTSKISNSNFHNAFNFTERDNFYCVKIVQIRSFFWSVFSCIQSEYGDLLRKSPYLARIQEYMDQKKLRILDTFYAVFFHATKGDSETLRCLQCAVFIFRRQKQRLEIITGYNNRGLPI